MQNVQLIYDVGVSMKVPQPAIKMCNASILIFMNVISQHKELLLHYSFNIYNILICFYFRMCMNDFHRLSRVLIKSNYSSEWKHSLRLWILKNYYSE